MTATDFLANFLQQFKEHAGNNVQHELEHLLEVFERHNHRRLGQEDLVNLSIRLHGAGTRVKPRQSAPGRLDELVYEIGLREPDGFFAKCERGPGPVKELERLERAARSSDWECAESPKKRERKLARWLKSWAKTSPRTINLIEAQAPKGWLRNNVSCAFSVPGLVINAPKPRDALPYVAAALASLPRNRGYTENPDLDCLDDEIAHAFTRLRGRPVALGGWRRQDDLENRPAARLEGPFLSFWREILAVYQLPVPNQPRHRVGKLKVRQAAKSRSKIPI